MIRKYNMLGFDGDGEHLLSPIYELYTDRG